MPFHGHLSIGLLKLIFCCGFRNFQQAIVIDPHFTVDSVKTYPASATWGCCLDSRTVSDGSTFQKSSGESPAHTDPESHSTTLPSKFNQFGRLPGLQFPNLSCADPVPPFSALSVPLPDQLAGPACAHMNLPEVLH